MESHQRMCLGMEPPPNANFPPVRSHTIISSLSTCGSLSLFFLVSLFFSSVVIFSCSKTSLSLYPMACRAELPVSSTLTVWRLPCGHQGLDTAQQLGWGSASHCACPAAPGPP